MSTSRFRINAPDVVHEVIEGEAVIVNLSNGVYYSVDRSGADIWTLIDQGLAVPQIVQTVAARYAGSVEEMESSIGAFIAQLQAENLVAPDGDSPQRVASPLSAEVTYEAYRPRFEAPTLHRYTDMEDLLLLDPVHEIDEEAPEPDQRAAM